MKYLFILLPILIVSISAEEIVLDGTYSQKLENPFLEKLDIKTKDVSIKKVKNKLIKLNVESNYKESNFISKNPEFYINSNDCNNILKNLLLQKYNLKNNSSLEMSCSVLPSKVTIEYINNRNSSIPNSISNIIVDTHINLTIVKDKKVILNKNISKIMDRNVEMNGDNYDFTIRSTFNFSNENIQESIQKIFEYSIFNLLNQELKGF